jgi:hypothetical protein
MLIFRSNPGYLGLTRSAAAYSPFMAVTLRDELEQDLSDPATTVNWRSPG